MEISFESRVERLDTGQRMHVIPVPHDMAAKLGGNVRVVATINSMELKRAILAFKSGEPYLKLGQKLLKTLRLREGSLVTVGLILDQEPDAVKVAAELLEALRQDDAAQKRWGTFTSGRKCSLNDYVETAKREETRVRRAVELAQKIGTHALYGD